MVTTHADDAGEAVQGERWLLTLKREMTDLHREVDGLIRERALEVQIGQAARQARRRRIRGGSIVDFDGAVGDTDVRDWERPARAFAIGLGRLFLDESGRGA